MTRDVGHHHDRSFRVSLASRVPVRERVRGIYGARWRLTDRFATDGPDDGASAGEREWRRNNVDHGICGQVPCGQQVPNSLEAVHGTISKRSHCMYASHPGSDQQNELQSEPVHLSDLGEEAFGASAVATVTLPSPPIATIVRMSFRSRDICLSR